MKNRTVTIKRKTKETDITVKLNIDGSGKTKFKTGIGLLDHMLELFSFHGLFDLDILAKGDLNVDIHHTNEDIGIVMGDAFKKALGDKLGIKRFGSASVPMEEVVASVALDISGRGTYKLKRDSAVEPEPQDGYSLKDAEHFFESFAKRLFHGLGRRYIQLCFQRGPDALAYSLLLVIGGYQDGDTIQSTWPPGSEGSSGRRCP